MEVVPMQLQVTGPADNSNRWFRDSWQRLMLVSGGILLLTFWTLAGTILVFQWVGNSSTKVAGFVVAGYSVMSGLAALSTWRSRGRSSGLEARTWRNITLGLAAWTFGGIAYIVYLMTGGDPKEPTAWSQVGYIVAYLPWYFALWQLRQPALTSSRRRQFETLQVEAAALLMLSVLVGSILWQPDWPVSHNLAQLVPAITDLLLLATFYGAVRRSNWSRATALTWLGYSFAALGGSDILMTLFVEQGHVLLGGAADARNSNQVAEQLQHVRLQVRECVEYLGGGLGHARIVPIVVRTNTSPHSLIGNLRLEPR